LQDQQNNLNAVGFLAQLSAREEDGE